MFVYIVNFSGLKRRAKTLLAGIAVLTVLAIIALSVERTVLNIEDASMTGASAEGTVIIIDAGHGGEDAGTTGVTGVYEKDLNLEFALIIGQMLIDEGYTVVYTRTTDKMLYNDGENIKGMRKLYDLKNRCKIAEGYEDAIFVSIHMNSFGSAKYSGLQVYYSNDNKESISLATSIQNTVREKVQNSNNRQIKNGRDLYILDNCKATTVLVECGFLSNETECQKLSEKEYQKELSFSIVCGIINYIATLSAQE